MINECFIDKTEDWSISEKVFRDEGKDSRKDVWNKQNYYLRKGQSFLEDRKKG